MVKKHVLITLVHVILLMLLPVCHASGGSGVVERVEKPRFDVLLEGNRIWIESDYIGCTGDQIDVMVMMENETTPVDAVTMNLQFDTTMLVYDGCVAGELDPGWTLFDCNEAEPGNITIAGFALPPKEIPAGSEGVLVVVTFTVTCDSCEEGDTSELIPHNFKDDIVDFTALNGLFTFSCVSTPTPVPTETPTPEEPTPTPTDEGPTATPTDVGPTATPTDVGPTATPTQIPPDFIWIGTDYVGCTTDQIDVMVLMSNAETAVDAFTMNVIFNTEMLEYDNCVAGDLDPGWTMFDCNEATPGNITVAGFSLPPNEIPAGSTGVLVTLTFTVTCNSCLEGDSSELIPHNFRDDIADFGAGNGLFTFNCEGTPTPVPTDTPTTGPTDTPIPDPTDTPTHTPTNTPRPTNTPVISPTNTPTAVPPTNTPTAVPPTNTPTPPECDWLGTKLELSQKTPYQTGDIFWLRCDVCTDVDRMNIPTAILLHVYGEFWFWPSWSKTFDLAMMNYEAGMTSFYALEPFAWPAVVGSATGIDFFSAMLTPELNDIIGEYGYATCGYEGEYTEMWGYINGRALVEVSGMGYDPVQDKESIFHLYHPTTEAWLNIRHREGNKYQPKGALDWEYACHDEIDYWSMQSGGNGVWVLEWKQLGDTTEVTITSPTNGVSVLHFVGGAAAWREIRHGSGDARIPLDSPATVTVLELTGTIGEAIECQE